MRITTRCWLCFFHSACRSGCSRSHWWSYYPFPPRKKCTDFELSYALAFWSLSSRVKFRDWTQLCIGPKPSQSTVLIFLLLAVNYSVTCTYCEPMVLVFRMLQYALLKVGYLMPLKVRIINSFIMPSEIPP